MSEIRKVRVGDIGRKILSVYRDDVHNDIKPTHRNKFDEHIYNDDFYEYDWESLRQSILEDGYDTNEYAPIRVHTNDKEFKYHIIDGVHRAFILQEIFGDDYLIYVDVKGPKKNSDKKPITHYVELLNNWAYLVYFLVFHTIPIIVSILTFYAIQKYLPNNQLYKTLNKGTILSKINGVSERLYVVVLTIINNTQMIAYIIVAISISLYMLIKDFYGILIIVIITNLYSNHWVSTN